MRGRDRRVPGPARLVEAAEDNKEETVSRWKMKIRSWDCLLTSTCTSWHRGSHSHRHGHMYTYTQRQILRRGKKKILKGSLHAKPTANLYLPKSMDLWVGDSLTETSVQTKKCLAESLLYNIPEVGCHLIIASKSRQKQILWPGQKQCPQSQ